MFKRIFLSSLLIGSFSFTAISQTELTGRQIYEKVNARDDGEHVTRKFRLELTDRRGVTRTEETIGYRKYFGDEKRTVLFYTAPNNVRGTGFLTFDYADASVDDDQWLYLPALRKVRRISASDRGDNFLGTDFTYEEIKKEGKIEIEDYTYEVLGEEIIDGFPTIKVQSTPVNSEIEKELGVSKVVSYIDPNIWMARKSVHWDVNGNKLKTIVTPKIEQIDGIWSNRNTLITNHKTGHQTNMTFFDIDFESSVRDSIFSKQSLQRGVR